MNNAEKARWLMQKISLAGCEISLAYLLMKNIICALTADGGDHIVEYHLNEAEKFIEKAKTIRNKTQREKFLASFDEHLKCSDFRIQEGVLQPLVCGGVE